MFGLLIRIQVLNLKFSTVLTLKYLQKVKYNSFPSFNSPVSM